MAVKFADEYESTLRIKFYHKKEILAEMGLELESRLRRIVGSAIAFIKKTFTIAEDEQLIGCEVLKHHTGIGLTWLKMKTMQ